MRYVLCTWLSFIVGLFNNREETYFLNKTSISDATEIEKLGKRN